MTSVADFLASMVSKTQEKFKKSRSILSFSDYISEVYQKPSCHIRNSAQYFADFFDEFGSYELDTPTGKLSRSRVFDADFAQSEGRIFGQEKVQAALIAQIKNFVCSGRIDKLLLLHGPNGSAKTSIIQAITRAAEYYSHTDEGALYQFSWIFPRKESIGGCIGFNGSAPGHYQSYAHLPNEAVDAQLPCDQRDHPLLLLRPEQRLELFKQLGIEKVPVIFQAGELSHRNALIYDALLASYSGDLAQVLRHVRVERFYLSRRYKRGVSVVEPQMSVDAWVQKLTSDQSILSLPANLRNLSLNEVFGPLLEANRGLIEYSDLLKRPLDAWKYLLVACEQAQVSIGGVGLFFDLLLVASSNELHLASFKEYPDWPSFKGRIELIKVPYLLRSADETGIYENQVAKILVGVHLAPHAIAMAARWAVLTRLEPPNAQKYPLSLQEVIRDLSPDEKLALYDHGEAPLRLSQKQARELRGALAQLFHEYQHEAQYEGRFGASPREIKMIIMNAAQDKKYDHLSPGAIFEHIDQLIGQKSSYDYLRREPLRGFRDASFLLSSVKRYYKSILEDEVRTALGLYSTTSYLELFTRYILHVSSWIKKEKLLDPLLGRYTDPDESFMRKIEAKLLAPREMGEDFRRQLIAQIGAAMLEYPEQRPDYGRIFSSHLRRLKDHVYAEQRAGVDKIIGAFLRLLDNEQAGIDEREVAQALILKEGLYKLGYTNSSARWSMAYLLKNNYLIEELNDEYKKTTA
jgi:predicted Ser/Thr protein kinase